MAGRNFIWDLDGTLLDSYHVIVDGLHDALAENGVVLSKEEIYARSIRDSVNHFLETLQWEHPFDMEKVSARNKELAHTRVLDITLMEHAKETLAELEARGDKNFVYTHKGVTSEIILRHLGILDLFQEVVNSQYGLPRKPHPGAIDYLVQKYGMNPYQTYYVGDRKIDMECAFNAGVGSILYLPEGNVTEPTGHETYVVKDLVEICKIP